MQATPCAGDTVCGRHGVQAARCAGGTVWRDTVWRDTVWRDTGGSRHGLEATHAVESAPNADAPLGAGRLGRARCVSAQRTSELGESARSDSWNREGCWNRGREPRDQRPIGGLGGVGAGVGAGFAPPAAFGPPASRTSSISLRMS